MARTAENSTTTCGEEVTEDSPAGAPGPIDPATGQHTCYYVLKPEEIAKGFVRPVRTTYIHTVCGTATSMSQAIAETYAREPGYYGATFCAGCGKHLPVGEHGEFVWNDGSKVGT